MQETDRRSVLGTDSSSLDANGGRKVCKARCKQAPRALGFLKTSTKNAMSDPKFELLKSLLEDRRSIRRFARETVSPAVVERALELAILSPSSSNLQPWQFIRVQNPGPEIIACFLDQSAARTASELVIAVARPDLWKQKNQLLLDELMARKANIPEREPPHYRYLIHYHSRTVPFFNDRGWLGLRGRLRQVAVLALGLFRPVAREGFSAASLRERAIKSTALACQTFMLAITAQGYDSCPMEGFDSKRLKSYFHLPRGATVVMGIAIGHRDSSYVPPTRFRFPYADVVLDS